MYVCMYVCVCVCVLLAMFIWVLNIDDEAYIDEILNCIDRVNGRRLVTVTF